MGLRSGFNLHELNEIIADDIDVIGDFAPNALYGLVPQHLGDVVGSDTILEDEAVLGSDSAGIIRFHLDVHGSFGHGIYGNPAPPSRSLVAF
ncbi:hypothetical protein D3C77_361150 [compost metagenome]